MKRLVTTLALLILATPVMEIEAQIQTLGIIPLPQQTSPAGQVDIFIEAETYTPSFYRGRAEPTAGNTVRAVAMPVNTTGADQEFDYRWSINGQPISATDQAVTLIAPIGPSFTIKVTVLSNGQTYATETETVNLAEPTIIFYEDNALRGVGATAIKRGFSLIGEEASISPEPYFFGSDSISSLRGTWSVDGQATTVSDWRKLSFLRPEEPNDRYLIELDLINRQNFAEVTKGSFYLEMGI